MHPQPKPVAHALVRRRQRNQQKILRALCVDMVWKREGGRCEWCSRRLYRLKDAPSVLQVGHVDEIVKRSQGGSRTDPENCRLLCPMCHAKRHGLRVQ